MEYKSLFGPVASRRLGLSLGIDLVPYKTCSFDCIYCECGATTRLSLKREVFVQTNLVRQELSDFLTHSMQRPDCFTFSGGGEPTLALNIGEVIDEIKRLAPTEKIVVLTNSSLLNDPEVRKNISRADIISPSLDAVLEKSFIDLNCPIDGISVSDMVNGLIQLRNEFRGQIWLEIFIIPEINTSLQELKKFKEAILKIKPDKVQLNSMDRPGTKKGVPKAPKNLLEEIRLFWDLPNVEIIPGFKYSEEISKILTQDLKYFLIQTLKRRPSTLRDLCEITGKTHEEMSSLIQGLSKEQKINVLIEERGTFYSILN